MDTNISHLDADASIEHSARLPDEPDLDHIAHQSAPEMDETSGASVMPKMPPRRRGRLLSGVALGVLVVAAGGILFLSPFNTFVPVPPALTAFVADATHLVTGASSQRLPQANEPGASSQAAASSPAQKPQSPSYTNPVVAPAASLAATRVPPRPDTITASRYTAQPKEQSLQELLKLHPGDQDQPVDRHSDPVTTQSPSSANATREIQEPGSSVTAASAGPIPAQVDITSSVTQAALGRTTQPTIAPEPTPASSATSLPSTSSSQSVPVPNITVQADAPVSSPTPSARPSQAASATPETGVQVAFAKPPTLVLAVPGDHQEQAEVLQFVTGLSSEIARLRTENEMLRKDVARHFAEQDGRLADFNRRVSVAEARAALRSATDVGRTDETQGEPVTRVAMQPAATPITTANAARPGLQAVPSRARYHVLAASPGLALLAEVGRGGGDGAQLQVAVGDQVPGYGIVKSVSQRGPNWVVLTEHGSID